MTAPNNTAQTADASETSQYREAVVHVRTDRGGTAQATWGQVDIWRCITWQHEDPAYFNFSRIVQLPAGTEEPQLLAALTRLMERHDALRTRFRVDGATLTQTVYATTDLRIGLHTVPAGTGPQVAGQLAEQLKAAPFRTDEPDEPPVRCALVAEPAPGAALLVFAFDHLALDGSSAQVLLAELLSLLADGEPAPTVQPLEIAEFEAGPGGRRASALALEHWRRNLRHVPRSLFDHPGRKPLNPPVRRYTLSSQAAAVAATKAAARGRVSTSTVLLTAVAAVLGAHSGRQRLALQLISANRLDARRAALVAPQAQNTLCVFDCTGLSFDAAARQCAVSALAAYAAGAYDPADLDEVLDEAAAERGAPFDLSVFFNDVRRREYWEGAADVADEAQLERLVADSAVRPAGEWDRVNARFFVDVQYAPDRCVLNAQVDTERVTPDEAAAWLRGVERLLVNAAFADVSIADPAALAAATGVAQVERGPEWVERGPDWVWLPRV